METKEYYIEDVSCRPHNKKTQALGKALDGMKGALVTFTDDFTQEMMLEWAKGIAKAANAAGRGKDIKAYMWDGYTGKLNISFQDNHPFGDTAIIRMSPVLRHIGDANDLPKGGEG